MFGNAFLGYQNIRLRAPIPRPGAREGLALGSTVTSLSLKNGSEGKVELRFPSGEKPVVLYSISSSCEFCAKNADLARALEARIQADYQFITLCVDGNLEGCRGKTGKGPVYVPTPESAAALRLGPVPQTILLSASGRVERVWTGGFQNANKEELETYFGAPLQTPDCVSSPEGAGCNDIDAHS